MPGSFENAAFKNEYINTMDAKVDRPGYTQTDTVAHCGTSAAGLIESA